MTITSGSLPNSATRTVTNAIRDTLFGSRRRLLVVGAGVLGLGLLFKWNWLVAVGVAPLLLSVLPCLAMCALGLCMGKMAGGSSGAQASSPDGEPGPAVPLRLAAPSGGLSGPQTPAGAPAGATRS